MSTLNCYKGNSCSYWQTSSYLLQDCPQPNTGVGRFEDGNGKYSVVGGAGDDTIAGGDGDDTITGSAGNDTLTVMMELTTSLVPLTVLTPSLISQRGLTTSS